MSQYVISDSYPVARKKHVCDWCGLSIKKGERYYRWTDTYDGLQTGKMHRECRLDARDCADYRESMAEYEDERNVSREKRKKEFTK